MLSCLLKIQRFRSVTLLLLSFSGLFPENIALAQEQYTRVQGRYRASDLAKKHFGNPPPYPSSLGTNFASVQLGVRSTLDCGRIDVVTDFNAQFAKIREQITGFTDNIEGYISAAPMMILCYTQPQVCALLRHDHFQFAQNLNLRAQACAAIDKYIDNQADKGARQLRSEAKKNCVENALQSGSDMASATGKCERNTDTGFPLRDFSQSVRRVQLQLGQKQRALFAMLQNVQEESTYDFMVALLGEIEVQTDGSWQPLWPNRMLKPREVASNYIRRATDLICSAQLRNTLQAAPLNASSGRPPTIESTISKYLTSEDADLLDDLFEEDKRLACAALGRALGLISAKQVSAHHDSIFASAITNTAVPSALRDEYRARARNAFEALERSLNAEQIPNLESVRENIRELARYMRAANRASGASLTKARSINQSEKDNDRNDCIDSHSCE
jgi:hypothetical protein